MMSRSWTSPRRQVSSRSSLMAAVSAAAGSPRRRHHPAPPPHTPRAGRQSGSRRVGRGRTASGRRLSDSLSLARLRRVPGHLDRRFPSHFAPSASLDPFTATTRTVHAYSISISVPSGSKAICCAISPRSRIPLVASIKNRFETAKSPPHKKGFLGSRR